MKFSELPINRPFVVKLTEPKLRTAKITDPAKWAKNKDLDGVPLYDTVFPNYKGAYVAFLRRPDGTVRAGCSIASPAEPANRRSFGHDMAIYDCDTIGIPIVASPDADIFELAYYIAKARIIAGESVYFLNQGSTISPDDVIDFHKNYDPRVNDNA